MLLTTLLPALNACFGLVPTNTGTPPDTADSASPEETGGPPDDTGSEACVQMGVATSSTDWELPPDYAEGTFNTPSDTRPGNDPSWAFRDLDGNGRTDIVITSADGVDVEGLGTTAWALHSNTGSKFRSEVETWDLPGGYPQDTFVLTYDAATAVSPAWALADLDGDGHDDLVVTYDSASSVDGVGTKVWLVYVNTGKGFAGSSTSWALPPGFAEGALSALSDTVAADPTWGLADLDGDDRLDFVVTHDAGDPGIGTTSWRVYLNTGSGFSSTGEEWLLPEGYPTDTFDRLYDDDVGSAPSWSLYDIDGNGRSDVVVTRDDGAGVEGLGTTTWRFYSNTGSRFRTEALPWALPSGYPTNTFSRLNDTDSASPNWSVGDYDVDGAPDLLVTRNDDAGIDELGTSRWQLFSGDGESGFASSNTAWPLPKEYANLSFQSVTDDNPASPGWMLTDLDADGLYDVVIVEDGGTATGSTRWLPHTGKCR
jgi:hypothetical protein